MYKYFIVFLAIYSQVFLTIAESKSSEVKEVAVKERDEVKEKKKHSASVKSSCYSPYIAYTVQPGDTCNNLEYKYIISPSSQYLCGTYLQVGAILCVQPIYNYNYQPAPYNPPNYYPTCYSPYTAYTVQYGDTCNNLQYKYYISSSSLYLCGATLQVGAILCVKPAYHNYEPAPYYPSQPSCYSPYSPYTVQYGDTCNSLQYKYIISPSSQYLCGETLQVGTILCVQSIYYDHNPLPYNPVPTPYPVAGAYPSTYPFICNLYSLCPSGAAPYIIKNGDSCTALAANRGYPVSTLQYNNPGLSCYPDYLASYAGQCLCF